MVLQEVTANIDIQEYRKNKSYRQKMIELLSGDLDFHGEKSNGMSHSFHSFPAKFPPQLPRKFIAGLTSAGEIVFDPMSGSGTTMVEAAALKRQGIGFDIDPLALKIFSTKTFFLHTHLVQNTTEAILKNAKLAIKNSAQAPLDIFQARWDKKTKKFVDYWFDEKAQLELAALMLEIEKLDNENLRSFFELAFSAIIVTKSGGVSMALDLGHTRPHRAKVVFGRDGEKIIDEEVRESRKPFVTKKLRPVFGEFKKRCEVNMQRMMDIPLPIFSAFGNAEQIPLMDQSVDLVVTSPPYASNAIDYMRAHKFSLVWMGYSIDELSNKRKKYIGGDAISDIQFEEMPSETDKLIAKIAQVDQKKSLVIHRYYSEMTRTLREVFRVLKHGKSAIFVVGNSNIRGISSDTHVCLAEIGEMIGFEVPKIGERNLDRNRRMMPASAKVNENSQIQKRMHKEYVIGFYKPYVRRDQ